MNKSSSSGNNNNSNNNNKKNSIKALNFPDNLDFKGMIVAKFLIRSHFLSI